jgi:hypothetical protein
MSANITAFAPLEHPRTLPGSPKTVIFDGQLFLGGSERPLICQLHYFNASDKSFDSINYIFFHAKVGICTHPCQPYHALSQIAKMHHDLPSHSDTMSAGEYDIVGDIIWVSQSLLSTILQW